MPPLETYTTGDYIVAWILAVPGAIVVVALVWAGLVLLRALNRLF